MGRQFGVTFENLSAKSEGDSFPSALPSYTPFPFQKPIHPVAKEFVSHGTPEAAPSRLRQLIDIVLQENSIESKPVVLPFILNEDIFISSFSKALHSSSFYQSFLKKNDLDFNSSTSDASHHHNSSVKLLDAIGRQDSSENESECSDMEIDLDDDVSLSSNDPTVSTPNTSTQSIRQSSQFHNHGKIQNEAIPASKPLMVINPGSSGNRPSMSHAEDTSDSLYGTPTKPHLPIGTTVHPILTPGSVSNNVGPAHVPDYHITAVPLANSNSMNNRAIEALDNMYCMFNNDRTPRTLNQNTPVSISPVNHQFACSRPNKQLEPALPIVPNTPPSTTNMCVISARSYPHITGQYISDTGQSPGHIPRSNFTSAGTFDGTSYNGQMMPDSQVVGSPSTVFHSPFNTFSGASQMQHHMLPVISASNHFSVASPEHIPYLTDSSTPFQSQSQHSLFGDDFSILGVGTHLDEFPKIKVEPSDETMLGMNLNTLTSLNNSSLTPITGMDFGNDLEMQITYEMIQSVENPYAVTVKQEPEAEEANFLPESSARSFASINKGVPLNNNSNSNSNIYTILNSEPGSSHGSDVREDVERSKDHANQLFGSPHGYEKRGKRINFRPINPKPIVTLTTDDESELSSAGSTSEDMGCDPEQDVVYYKSMIELEFQKYMMDVEDLVGDKEFLEKTRFEEQRFGGLPKPKPKGKTKSFDRSVNKDIAWAEIYYRKASQFKPPVKLNRAERNRILEAKFRVKKKLNKAEVKQMAEETGMSEKSLRIWFANKRSRTK